MAVVWPHSFRDGIYIAEERTCAILANNTIRNNGKRGVYYKYSDTSDVSSNGNKIYGNGGS